MENTKENTLYITFTNELDSVQLNHLYTVLSEFVEISGDAHITESNTIVNTTEVNLCEADDPDHFCYEFTLEGELAEGDELNDYLLESYDTYHEMEYIKVSED